jgi:hypothetical protein
MIIKVHQCGCSGPVAAVVPYGEKRGILNFMSQLEKNENRPFQVTLRLTAI